MTDWAKRVLLVAALAVICELSLTCSGGGGGVTPPTNHAPEITDVAYLGASPIASGSLAEYVVSATDADGDQIHYGVSADNGGGASYLDIEGRENYCTFWAPEVTVDTTVTLTFTVSDDNGGSDEAQAEILVRAPLAGNTAPVVTSVTIDPQPVPAGGGATVTTVASDVDGDTLTYTYIWGSHEGALAEAGPGLADYSAPATVAEPFNCLFDVYVDDGNGHFTRSSTLLHLVP